MAGARQRRVLVTGAASGIGRSVVARFRANGDRVAGFDVDDAALATVELEVRICGDVTEEPSVRDGIEQAATALGGIDVLVNSAGTMIPGDATEIEVANWDLTMAVNARGPFLFARHAIPHLRAAGGGSIVTVASQLGLVGVPGAVAYCASKGAAIQLTRALALDLATEGITVNAVCPGPTETPLLQRHMEATGDAAGMRSALEAELPIGRLIDPAEIAAAVFNLCAPDARATTGACLVVDGGYVAR